MEEKAVTNSGTWHNSYKETVQMCNFMKQQWHQITITSQKLTVLTHLTENALTLPVLQYIQYSSTQHNTDYASIIRK